MTTAYDCHLQEPQAVKLAVAQDCSENFAKAREESLKEMSATHPEFQQILYKPPGSHSELDWIDSSFDWGWFSRKSSITICQIGVDGRLNQSSHSSPERPDPS